MKKICSNNLQLNLRRCKDSKKFYPGPRGNIKVLIGFEIAKAGYLAAILVIYRKIK
jgi:hypothetical protein